MGRKCGGVGKRELCGKRGLDLSAVCCWLDCSSRSDVAALALALTLALPKSYDRRGVKESDAPFEVDEHSEAAAGQDENDGTEAIHRGLGRGLVLAGG